MTVSQLIDALQQLDPHALIVAPDDDGLLCEVFAISAARLKIDAAGPSIDPAGDVSGVIIG